MKVLRAASCLLALASCCATENLLGFAGTYTRSSSKGIYSFRFDTATGAISGLKLAAESSNPSFLAVHPDGRHLYAVNEQAEGTVSAFAIDAESAMLKAINTRATPGGAPAHLAIDPSGKWLAEANYSGASVALFPIDVDGALRQAADFVQRAGSSIHQRQKGPHPHQVVFTQPGLFVVPDLGTDELVTFKIADGKLNAAGSVRFEPAFGPRHVVFDARGRFAYVLGEIASTISVRALPGFAEKRKIAMLPDDFRGRNTSAEIAMNPNVRWLYASNRGLDGIAAFEIGADGTVTPAGRYSTLGKTPRHFALGPNGNYLLAANQDSDSVVVFRIDRSTGKLTPTGAQVTIPMPVCVIFAGRH
jgi:6-phosphogluconolactonase